MISRVLLGEHPGVGALSVAGIDDPFCKQVDILAFKPLRAVDECLGTGVQFTNVGSALRILSIF